MTSIGPNQTAAKSWTQDCNWYNQPGSSASNADSGLSVVNWISNQGQRSTAVKNRKQVKYPIFELCAKIAQEKMWQTIFLSASKGKFPTHISYRDENLFYKKGSRIYQICVPSDPLEAFNLCKGFIANYTGLRSVNEQQIERDIVQRARSKTNYNRWSDIKRSLQELLIYNFAEYVYSQMKLDPNQSHKLVSVIKIGIVLKQIKNEHIQMYSNRIYRITNLYYDPEQNSWSIQCPEPIVRPRTTTVFPPEEKKVTGDSFEKLWSKYLTKQRDTAANSLRSQQNIYQTYSMFSQLSKSHNSGSGDGYFASGQNSSKRSRGRPCGSKNSQSTLSISTNATVSPAATKSPTPTLQLCLDIRS